MMSKTAVIEYVLRMRAESLHIHGPDEETRNSLGKILAGVDERLAGDPVAQARVLRHTLEEIYHALG